MKFFTSKQTWVFLILAAVALAFYYLQKSSPTIPPADDNSGAVVTQKDPNLDKPDAGDSEPDLNPQISPLPQGQEVTFVAAAQKCFIGTEFESLASVPDLSSFVQALEGQGIDHEQKKFENDRYHMSDGSERELQVIYDEDGKLFGLQLSGFDASGAPMAVPLTDEEEEDPTEDMVQNRLHEGDVFETLAGRMVWYRNGLMAEIETRNGTAEKILIQFAKGTFTCSPTECKCL